MLLPASHAVHAAVLAQGSYRGMQAQFFVPKNGAFLRHEHSRACMQPLPIIVCEFTDGHRLT